MNEIEKPSWKKMKNLMRCLKKKKKKSLKKLRKIYVFCKLFEIVF